MTAMNEHPTITVSLVFERRGEDIYFRAAHKDGAEWHGPYQNLQELAETIGQYVLDDVGEALLRERY